MSSNPSSSDEIRERIRRLEQRIQEANDRLRQSEQDRDKRIKDRQEKEDRIEHLLKTPVMLDASRLRKIVQDAYKQRYFKDGIFKRKEVAGWHHVKTGVIDWIEKCLADGSRQTPGEILKLWDMFAEYDSLYDHDACHALKSYLTELLNTHPVVHEASIGASDLWSWTANNIRERERKESKKHDDYDHSEIDFASRTIKELNQLLLQIEYFERENIEKSTLPYPSTGEDRHPVDPLITPLSKATRDQLKLIRSAFLYVAQRSTNTQNLDSFDFDKVYVFEFPTPKVYQSDGYSCISHNYLQDAEMLACACAFLIACQTLHIGAMNYDSRYEACAFERRSLPQTQIKPTSYESIIYTPTGGDTEDLRPSPLDLIGGSRHDWTKLSVAPIYDDPLARMKRPTLTGRNAALTMYQTMKSAYTPDTWQPRFRNAQQQTDRLIAEQLNMRDQLIDLLRRQEPLAIGSTHNSPRFTDSIAVRVQNLTQR